MTEETAALYRQATENARTIIAATVLVAREPRASEVEFSLLPLLTRETFAAANAARKTRGWEVGGFWLRRRRELGLTREEAPVIREWLSCPAGTGAGVEIC